MLSCVVFNVRLSDVCTGFGFVGWGVVEIMELTMKMSHFLIWCAIFIAFSSFAIGYLFGLAH